MYEEFLLVMGTIFFGLLCIGAFACTVRGLLAFLDD